MTGQQRHDAVLLARAGYDLIIGLGPTRFQPVDIINGTPMLYSLGNFTVAAKGRFTERERGYALIARTTLTTNGPSRSN